MPNNVKMNHVSSDRINKYIGNNKNLLESFNLNYSQDRNMLNRLLNETKESILLNNSKINLSFGVDRNYYMNKHKVLKSMKKKYLELIIISRYISRIYT